MGKMGKRKRRSIMGPMIVLTALVVAVAATSALYMLRSGRFEINVADYSQVNGMPAIGFYTGDNEYLLPAYGGVNNTVTYVDTGGTEHYVYTYFSGHTYTSSGTPQIKLYGTARIVADLTEGSWKFDKALTIGVPGDADIDHFTIKFRVDDPSDASLAIATVKYTDGTNEYSFGQIDLTVEGETGSLSVINPPDTGAAFYITIELQYDQPITDSFTLSAYVTP